jgi:hypothetical protein
VRIFINGLKRKNLSLEQQVIGIIDSNRDGSCSRRIVIFKIRIPSTGGKQQKTGYPRNAGNPVYVPNLALHLLIAITQQFLLIKHKSIKFIIAPIKI